MRFFLFSVFLSNLSFAQPIFDRASWTTWQGKWEGDLWNPGNFGNSIYMTCVGTQMDLMGHRNSGRMGWVTMLPR